MFNTSGEIERIQVGRFLTKEWLMLRFKKPVPPNIQIIEAFTGQRAYELMEDLVEAVKVIVLARVKDEYAKHHRYFETDDFMALVQTKLNS